MGRRFFIPSMPATPHHYTSDSTTAQARGTAEPEGFIPPTPGNRAIMTRCENRQTHEITVLRANCPDCPNHPPSWSSRPPARPPALPVGLAGWLFDPGSLTQRLRRSCLDRFRVHVLHQGWARPGRDETSALGLRLDAWTWTREVQLLCGERPWVFARTLIPAATLRGRGRRLTRLGSRPLGQVLFADPKVRRGPVEIARIVAGQHLHQRAFAGFAEPPDAIWGRRSVFWIDGRCPLLVCEIFLPALPVSPALVDRTGFPS